MTKPNTAEYKAIIGGYQCSNCQLFTETKSAHYCPSCAAQMDNWEDDYPPGYWVDAFGGSDF